MNDHHTSKNFDLELESLRTRVLQMGGMAEQQVHKAVKGLYSGDKQLLEEVIRDDDLINQMEVEIDASSRFLVPPELRASAGLVRDLMLLGMGSHFELWDAQRYAEYEAKVMQSEMPESLKSFSF